MNKIIYLVFSIVCLVAVSCSAPKELGYYSDAERDSAQRILTTYTNTIHPGDQLYIYVNSEMIESVIPFNQETHTEAVEMSRVNSAGLSSTVKFMMDEYYQGSTKLGSSSHTYDEAKNLTAYATLGGTAPTGGWSCNGWSCRIAYK